MKRIIAYTTLLFITTSGFAQNHGIVDSLKKQLTSTTADSSRLDIYSSLAGNYLWTDNDSAIFYGYKALSLAEKMGNKLQDIVARIQIFTAEGLKRNDAVAIKTMYETQNLAEQWGHESPPADWQLIKDYVQRQSGILYNTIGDYKRSLQTLFSLTNSRKDYWKTDSLGLAFIIGQNYYESNQLDSAVLFINKAMVEDKQEGRDWAFLHILLGNTYRKMKRYDVASAELHKALFLLDPKVDPLIDFIKMNVGLSQTFYETGNFDSALYYAKAAMSTPGFNAFPDWQLQAFTLLKDIYKTKNNTDSAYKYTALALTLTDSITNADKTRTIQRTELEQQMNEVKAKNEKIAFQNQVKVYALIAALAIFLLICIILIRNNRHKQKAYALLQRQKVEIDLQKQKVESALQELKATQAQLIQSEKMASLGELTAGIAHEIQNPLNFVNNFSEINTELIEELKEERAKKNGEIDVQLEAELLEDIEQNLQKINHHGKRADSIVKGMLEHSRTSKGEKQLTNINALADKYLRLAYHGLRAKDKSFNTDIKTSFDEQITRINLVPQDIGRVLLNLFNNAFYAVNEKKSKLNGTFQPVVSVITKKLDGKVEIIVTDNGNGIPQNIINKIFQPFFTTKPTGQGTGLGLSLSYDIIKAHSGELKVESKEGEGTTFIIQL